jgi:hypothetical protein
MFEPLHLNLADHVGWDGELVGDEFPGVLHAAPLVLLFDQSEEHRLSHFELSRGVGIGGVHLGLRGVRSKASSAA